MTITTQNDHTVTLTGITPDSSWYRADPDVPAYTITAVIPDANSVPDITGFAPAESNPFNVGEVKKFRVWSDESLDKMDWYVDGALVASGSLSYAWTVASGGHTIEFRGSNNGGSVSQRWEVNGGSSVVLPSISESFPLDSSPVQLNGSTYEFSVSTDQPMTSDEWLLDGVVVATGAQTYTHTWAHASTHVLTYTGSNENGAVSQSWTVEVLDNTNDAGQSPDNSTGQSNPALISDPHIVYGHITDTDGAGVSGLTVTITTSQEQLSEVTDSEGRYDVVLSSYLDGETVTVSANDADFNGMNTGIVNYNAGSTTVDVTVSRFEDFTYQFQQGWNMFSTPLINDTMDAASFSALSPGIKYVVDYATGKAYINGFSSPGDNFAINPDRGYLVYMTAGDSVIISGTRPSGVRIVQLEQGYNLVGWTSMAHSTVTSAFVEPLAGKVKYVTKRDSDFSGYQTYIVGFSGPDEDFAVVPGGAYYVYVNEPCTLSYTAR